MESDVPKVHYKLKGDREEFEHLWKEPESNLKEKGLGIRVFYFNEAVKCDHVHSDYNEKWKMKLEKGTAVEAGTTVAITACEIYNGEKKKHYLVVIRWDCGFIKSYTEAEFDYLRVFDLGPTGYKGEMVFCDKCLIPVMGFAWRLVKDSESGDLYDLCCAHYNENEDPHSRDHFYCNIPTGNIMRQSDDKYLDDNRPLEPRSESDSTKVDLIGLFKGATVTDLRSKKEFDSGTIFKIEHEDKRQAECGEFEAQQDMRRSVHYNCCAEVIRAAGKPLVYRSVGVQGRLEIKVVNEPGIWGPIYAAHHPPLCLDLLYELATLR